MARVGRALKEMTRLVAPPILVRMVDRLRAEPRRQGHGFEGRYDSYEECRRAADGSYDQASIVDGCAARTRDVRDRVSAEATRILNDWALQHLAAMHVAFAGGLPDSFSVLDFGGAMGVHYFSLKPHLARALRWTVCEMSGMASAGARLFGNGELSFVSDIVKTQERFDAVLASGALQYTDAPLDYLNRLLDRSDVVILNRLPFVADARDWCAVQWTAYDDLFSARFPAWFLSEGAWLEALRRRGFDLKMRWTDRDDTVSPDRTAVKYEGLLAVRR